MLMMQHWQKMLLLIDSQVKVLSIPVDLLDLASPVSVVLLDLHGPLLVHLDHYRYHVLPS